MAEPAGGQLAERGPRADFDDPPWGLLVLHLIPLAALWTGAGPADWLCFALLYLAGAFGLGAGLHRYFAHRSFETSRAFQFLLALLATSAFGDPIGFAGKHRLHHRYADRPGDVHAPAQGWWRCWILSLFDDGYSEAERLRLVPDLLRYPELRWLHRFHLVPGLVLALLTVALGGLPMLAVGFCLSRVLLIHMSSAVNYFGHLYGRRRYPTADRSTNHWLLAWLTFGEGWHNNHHRYPRAARAGFVWWEVDLLWLALRGLAALGLVWRLRGVPLAVRDEA